MEIGSADRVAFVVSSNVILAVSLYFVTRPKRSPRVGTWVFAVFALLNFLVADIIDLLFLLRSSENLNDSVLLLASAMALGISALSVFLYSAMMRYAEREYEIDARIFSVFSTGCISLDSALTVKELQMRQSGIRFERQLCALEETPIEDTELSTIVMNLLDNAIEAILRHASPPESPLIAFRIQRTREMLLIECRTPVDAATIRRRGERFLTSKSGRGHGVFHSKGDRPRGGTGGLRIRLCHHDLHDRKRPGVPAAGAPARPVPRRRGPDRHLTPVSPPAGDHASTHLRCFPTMCVGLLAGLGFSLLPCPLLALAVLAVPLTLHPNKQYLLENKKALILRSRLSVLANFAVAAALAALQWVPVSIVTAGYLLSALSRLYAKAHYKPTSA